MGRRRTGGGNEERRIRLDDAQLTAWFSEGKTIAEMAAIVGCSRPPILSALHRLGLRRPAKPRPAALSGDRNPAWSGGRRARTDGYIEVWTATGVRLEHQVVMETSLGRALQPDEIVHHVDENRSNNAPENLRVMTQAEHAALHAPDLVASRGGHKGAHNPRAKLTDEQVAAIRASDASSRALGAQYQVHPSTIQRIKNGSGWN